MATGNYAGKLFTLAGNLYMPILVANRVGAAEAAYFFVPWMVSLAIELVALNVMTSLTVEAASDMERLRAAHAPGAGPDDAAGRSRSRP